MRKAIFPACVLILIALLLGSCGAGTTIEPTPDVNAARTSAAKTVVSELTLTAAVFTPILEVLSTETATLAPEATATTTTPVVIVTNASGVPVQISATAVPCDSMTFNPATVDINIPDGSQMTPGQEFVKTWKVRNNGSCAWNEGYGLIFSYGDKMSGQPEPIGTVVQVGQEVEISISLKAPAKANEYTSAWQMASDKGIPFGPALYVKILVK
jgi:hypothetical protein